ncbi:DNA polymerase III subunit gamma/tau [Peptostreptococcus faecalis]|uniref:DNA polymerase III subunit gamma/tau n=1 Tax=Peptostreptococcus faecalis TaxID=2045015 RepID=UPI000C7D9F05|nr:DNA polymerase III subunit gamma/tau [Peptostreptococcus faecalis]
MHKALYREYRPLVFDDVIGQEHIIKTLKNQVNENNISHAYMFCGTRGTGKTSTAKIFSRAVNCTSNLIDKPCNECKECKSILDSSNLDVVEIDAASNNSVDDIRELRDTVKYTPNNSKYKVYIIDEVHMLSQGAFNALLKTLEEPPSYVIFILATTEPNKIPATIHSRCQRFDFRRVSIEELVKKMSAISQKEGIEIEEDALKIIARNANGSVRDSLSILDKCTSFSSEKITSSDVLDILGFADPHQLFELSKSIIDSDVGKSMELVEDFFMWGKDIKILVEELVSFFRSIMMIKIFNSSENFAEIMQDYTEQMEEISKNMDKNEIIRILNTLSELLDNLKYSSNQRMALEIYIMKLSSPSTDSSYESLYKRIENIEKLIEDGKINIKSNIQTVSTNINTQIPNSTVETTDIEEKTHVQPSAKFDIIDDEELDSIISEWDKLLEQMKRDKKMPLRAFLAEKSDLKYKNEILYVIFSDEFSFALDRLEEPENKTYIQNIMKKVFGLNIEPRFILKSNISKMDFNKADKATDEEETLDEKLLKDVLGTSLEIEK